MCAFGIGARSYVSFQLKGEEKWKSRGLRGYGIVNSVVKSA